MDKSLQKWAAAMPERYLSAKHVAVMLDVHVNTVQRMGDRGDLPFVRINARGDRRYLLKGMQVFLAQRYAREWREARDVPTPLEPRAPEEVLD